MGFNDSVKAELTVKVGSKSLTFPAGNIKRFSVDAHAYGFSASVEWWVVSQQSSSEDTLFAEFIKADPMEVTLKLDRTFEVEGEEASPLTLTGLVQERWVHERAFSDIEGNPVLQRRYRVRLADRGAVLWRQHFPTNLWVDQSLQEVIEANKPAGVTLAFEWKDAGTKYPIHSLGLGVDGNAASFYDFLHWVQDRENTGLFFDYASNKYTLRDSKDAEGEATELPFDDVAELRVRFPELRRDKVSVLNSYTAASTKKKDEENANKVDGVLHEYLLASTIEKDTTTRATLEGKRQKAPEPELVIDFQRYPSVTVAPNGLFSFGEDWSSNLYTNGKTYRMHRLSIEARAESEDPADNLEDETNTYQLEVSAALELKTDVTFKRPAYTPPRWPFHAEGKVVSEVGEEAERTYQAYEDADTSLEYYKVELPLWEKKLVAPYNPNQLPGHFYFPADKGARVMLALEFRRAFVHRFLEWRPGAKLPKETQGNHLLLGKKPESETSIQHVYQDAKPLLRIKRTSDKDTQLLEVSEGRLYLETKETKE